MDKQLYVFIDREDVFASIRAEKHAFTRHNIAKGCKGESDLIIEGFRAFVKEIQKKEIPVDVYVFDLFEMIDESMDITKELADLLEASKNGIIITKDRIRQVEKKLGDVPYKLVCL